MDDVRRENQLVAPLALLLAALVLVTLLGGCTFGSEANANDNAGDAGASAPALAASVTSHVVPDDPDDPAIWLHPTDPSRSLILGTNKVAAPAGALVVFGLDGKIRQTIAGIDRPNNVDVEQGVRLGDETIDVAVLTERLKHRLRVFRVDRADGHISEIGTVPVLDGQQGAAAEPMGVALYKRASDAALFAIVAPKTGGTTNYLWQYRLTRDSAGGVKGALVRRFGNFSGLGPTPDEAGEIEAVVADDVLGYVYYSDERYGIRKWTADPDSPDANRELAVIGTSGYIGDREGLAIYAQPNGAGYLVSTDQIPGGSILRFYRRSGPASAPHDHGAALFEVRTTADETDGLEVTSTSLPGFPEGLAVMMNSAPKNFLFFDWVAIRGRFPPG